MVFLNKTLMQTLNLIMIFGVFLEAPGINYFSVLANLCRVLSTTLESFTQDFRPERVIACVDAFKRVVCY